MAHVIVKNKLVKEEFEGNIFFRKETRRFLLDNGNCKILEVAAYRNRCANGSYDYAVVVVESGSGKNLVRFSLLSPSLKRSHILVPGQDADTGKFLPWSAEIRVQ